MCKCKCQNFVTCSGDASPPELQMGWQVTLTIAYTHRNRDKTKKNIDKKFFSYNEKQ